jgi:hypothetical protein
MAGGYPRSLPRQHRASECHFSIAAPLLFVRAFIDRSCGPDVCFHHQKTVAGAVISDASEE